VKHVVNMLDMSSQKPGLEQIVEWKKLLISNVEQVL
jgi:hypothetical protein